jgi:hypothetical protein
VRTWGGTGSDCDRFVKIGYPDNVYYCGYFNSQIDLDPGPGVDLHNTNGNYDIFLCRLDANGNFIWARTWGGSGSDQPYAIAINSLGEVYTAGSFSGTVNFDPGTGIDQHSTNGSTDVYLSKFNSNGDYQWALTWGGSSGDYAEGVAVSYSDDVYVAGNYYNTVDFDPGLGTDNHSSNGAMDIFLTKFNSTGSYEWTLTWGSNTTDDVHMMTIRGGNVFATGHFGNSMDFDPTLGVDMRTAVAGSDIYLIKVDCFANYVWARTWGGTGNEYSRGFAADNIGNLFLTGGFLSSTIDLNPGPGEDIHTGTSGDVYLIKMLPDGYW